ncbi:TetR/AcrR family transcriptional regulator [Phyllobacterium phragmitis]|uniref:TetR/AcrR family transcriptional regulator n=1 Tax=Phyllobacterium phragmitis TaxID=2670329 RepID=A0A2S9IU35_9HYPH|nr:TetR/AcrR family transcriptional regulator [Phyllobacterium phragmitis]PRD44028.1 TetR/AcrR family transcriptional regulator [Phyllobacterium phragmitis]
MIRVIKTPEVRLTELLDCAQRLFFSRGYDNTTINDIIGEAGISKGAFYHYFASKEALLEALAARMARDSVRELQPLLDNPELDAIGRLNALFGGARRMKVEMAPHIRNTFDVVFRPENVVLFHRIDRAVSAVVTPILSGILAEGAEEGILDAPDPLAFAEMLLQFRLSLGPVMHKAMQQAKDGNVDEAAQMLDERLRLYGLAIDRVLKLPDGTIEMAEKGFARALLDANQS